MSTVTVESSRFGTVRIAADAIIGFPSGLVGLDSRRWPIVGGPTSA
jgi:flagellar assembly factor FliW